MYLTDKLYRKLTRPPAHVLAIKSSIGFVVSGTDKPIKNGGMVLFVEHAETHDRWQQLFTMDLPTMRELASSLQLFVELWEQSHESEQGGA